MVPRGGQNPLEAAACYLPLVYGPHMENFHEESEELKQVGAARQVTSESELGACFGELLENSALRRQMGEAAGQYVLKKKGASERTAAALKELLGI